MIVSFKVEHVEDLELLLKLTERLNIERIDYQQAITHNSHQKKVDATTEVNDEINDIFGADNIDRLF